MLCRKEGRMLSLGGLISSLRSPGGHLGAGVTPAPGSELAECCERVWRAEPCGAPAPLFLSALSPRSPVATTLHWMFTSILSLCFGFFSHRWISCYFSWIKISVLPTVKSSWISSLGYSDVHEIYYWLRNWPTCCSLLGVFLSINQRSC